IISTVAGSTNGAPTVEGEPAASVRLEGPTGIAIDRNGTLYFAEGSIGSGTGLAKGDYRVWKVASTGVLAPVAGTGGPNFAGDGGQATAAQLNGAMAIGSDGSGNLFIADTANHRVRQIAPDGTITTIMGTGVPGFGGEYGSPGAAVLNSPGGVAAD